MPSFKSKPRKGSADVSHYNWKGGRYINRWGYVMIYSANSKLRPNHQGYIEEHRKVMEEHLGRKLKRSEIVIHLNKNPQDNRLKNLKIVTRGEQISFACKKDMSKRFCYICGSYTTYQRKDGSGRFTWYYIDSEGKIGGIHDEEKIVGYVCTLCYARHRNKSKNPYKWRTTKAANSHGGGSY